MKSIVGIKEEDKAELTVYVELIQRYTKIQDEQTERFNKAKTCAEILAASLKRLSALNLDKMDPAVLRNAEMITYFMGECREADKETALNANIAQAMKEALTLMLAEKYEIDIQKEWHLDLERGIISYDDYGKPPQD